MGQTIVQNKELSDFCLFEVQGPNQQLWSCGDGQFNLPHVFTDHLYEEERTGSFALIVSCLVAINDLWLFLTMQWVGQQCV